VALDPTHRRALGNLSVVYLNLNRVAEAKSVLRRLLPMAGSTDRKFWYNVASVQLADGKLDKACSALARALEIDPGYALALALRDRICPAVPAKQAIDIETGSGHGARTRRACELLSQRLLESGQGSLDAIDRHGQRQAQVAGAAEAGAGDGQDAAADEGADKGDVVGDGAF
jgi:tetratricopeptide (TPR) repeat protein